jgi:hypothetical protein
LGANKYNGKIYGYFVSARYQSGLNIITDKSLNWHFDYIIPSSILLQINGKQIKVDRRTSILGENDIIKLDFGTLMTNRTIKDNDILAYHIYDDIVANWSKGKVTVSLKVCCFAEIPLYEVGEKIQLKKDDTTYYFYDRNGQPMTFIITRASFLYNGSYTQTLDLREV